MDITKQQMKTLKILKEKLGNKALARSIEEAYNESGEVIGNVWEVMKRLSEEGWVKRVDDKRYTLTQNGENVLENKKDKKHDINITFEKKQVEEFHKLSAERDIIKRLSGYVCPEIIGLEGEKVAALASIVSDDIVNGDNNRVFVLLSGDPGTGKSKLLVWLQENLWGFYADKACTGPALTGGADGEQKKEGLLEKANGSIVYLDELEKMEKKDQAAILNAMSRGIITINKGRVVNDEREAMIRVIAACNNEQTIIEPLRDRFDLVFQTRKLSKEEKEGFIRLKMNDFNRVKMGGEGNPDFFKNYMRYAQRFGSALPEDREFLTEIIIEETRSGKLQGRGARGIESIPKIAIALAKLKLKRVVGIEEVKEAIELVKEKR